MMFRLAWRSLATRPIRSAVVAAGFGLGVAVMAALLGIGAAILEQARAPALVGGGDVAILGGSGVIPSARFVLSSVLGSAPFESRVAVAAPTREAPLYLIDAEGTATPIHATGGIPSLEHRLGEPEVRRFADWQDTPEDRAWASPDPAALLRAMDRFHVMPDVPARAGSWAEWLYFNGRTANARFYLTFLAGPVTQSGEREVGVRLQLERGGRMTSYADRATVKAAALLESAPDVTVGRNRLRLQGTDYHISLDLPAESGRGRATGEIVVHAVPGRSVPPLSIRGAGGWVSGYVVPVMSGTLDGAIQVGTEAIALDGGAAYHDHNWGFWNGVSWQWGQVQGGGLSFVYGRVHPPADAADPARIPGFLAAIGSRGLVGYATDVRIDEINDPATGRPLRIVVRGEGTSLALTFDLTVTPTTVTAGRQATAGTALDFLQLRGTCHVEGRAGGRPVNFTGTASAETFRGRRDDPGSSR